MCRIYYRANHAAARVIPGDALALAKGAVMAPSLSGRIQWEAEYYEIGGISNG